ncbi:MAG: TRAP transporter small permease [Syntrophaceae bacterium]|nr:TRAP transporter small permease [Syntrophaceae bacterium]
MNLGIPIERLNNALDKGLMIITGAALLVSTLLTFFGVILRYIFGISYEWNEELCRYCMITIVYLWAGAMIRKKQHISFTLFSDRLSPRNQDVHRFITDLLTLALGLPLVFWGFELVAGARAAELRTLSLLFPLWPAYSIVPIGTILLVVQAILDLFRLGIILFCKTPQTVR